MPWRCPACQIQIRHSELEERPQPGQTYRCHVCRLDLVLDAHAQKLTVEPLRSDHSQPDPRTKAATKSGKVIGAITSPQKE